MFNPNGFNQVRLMKEEEFVKKAERSKQAFGLNYKDTQNPLKYHWGKIDFLNFHKMSVLLLRYLQEQTRGITLQYCAARRRSGVEAQKHRLRLVLLNWCTCDGKRTEGKPQCSSWWYLSYTKVLREPNLDWRRRRHIHDNIFLDGQTHHWFCCFALTFGPLQKQT